MKQAVVLAAALAAFTAAVQVPAYANTIHISTAPDGESAYTAVQAPGMEGTAHAEASSPQSSFSGQPQLSLMALAGEETAAGPGTGSISGPENDLTGPGGILSETPGTAAGEEALVSDVPGAMHLGDAGTDVALPFKLVSPNVWRGDYYVAEGSVQLQDGSWDEISQQMAIRSPYYRVLREETDQSGTQWYVCAAYASQFGDYHTPDGSFAKELWLKKSDCRETTKLHLNTTNQKRINVVRTALQNLGKQYTYAGNGPDAFDCSGFVSYVFGQNGINVPRQSAAICAMPQQIKLAELRPGDIVGRPGHVGIYLGDGYFIHASETETGVMTERVDVYNRIHSFTNYINVYGD